MSGKEKLFFRKKFLLLIEDADDNYLKLFNEISKQAAEGNEYDETKIKEGNYSGKFIKNLPFHKNYLYNTILNSLSFLHKDTKDIYSIRNLLTQADILSDKNLLEQSLKLLQKANKTAVEKKFTAAGLRYPIPKDLLKNIYAQLRNIPFRRKSFLKNNTILLS
ncbi:MAG: hypothetical protein IPM96_01965 [Ignavibacteria bacterium]|nr:hypothetical protein [Ignavibacteria bacterium]